MAGKAQSASIFASFAVSTAQWSKGMGEAADDLAAFAKKAERAASEIGRLGLVASGAIVLAVHEAAKKFESMRDAVDGLTGRAKMLAAEFGKLFEPMLRQLSTGLGEVLGWFQSLSPTTKAWIADLVAGVAVIALGIGAIGKALGVVSGIAKTLSLIIDAELLAPLLLAVPIIVSIGLAFGYLYKAWNTAGSQVGQFLRQVWDEMKKFGEDIIDFFSQMANTTTGVIGQIFDFFLDLMASQINSWASLASSVASALGMDKIASALKPFTTLTGQALKDGLISGAKAAVEWTKNAFKDAIAGLKMAWTDIKGAAGFDGHQGVVTKDLAKPLTQPQIDQSLQAINDILKEQVSKFGEELRRSMDEAKKRIVDGLLSSLGDLGGMIKTAQAGMTAGGPMGAIAAVGMSLLEKSKQFQQIMQMVNQFIGQLADSVGSILAPLIPVIGAIFNMLAPILKIVADVLGQLLTPLESLVPLFNILGMLFGAFEPVINMVVKMLFALSPGLKIMQVAVEGLFYAIKYLGIGLIYIVKGIGAFWNGLIDVIAGILNALGHIPLLGKLKDWAKSLEDTKINQDTLNDSLNTLKNANLDTASAAQATTDSLNNMNEALTNAPKLLKKSLEEYRAINTNPNNPKNQPPPTSGTPGQTNGGPPGSGAPASTVIINAQTGSTPADIAREIRIGQKKNTYNQTGTTAVP